MDIPAENPPLDAATPARPEQLERVVQSAHKAVDRLADTAAPHVQRLQEGMASAASVLTTRTDQARELGDEWAESLRSTVREHPLTALVGAFAVGVLIARLRD